MLNYSGDQSLRKQGTNNHQALAPTEMSEDAIEDTLWRVLYRGSLKRVSDYVGDQSLLRQHATSAVRVITLAYMKKKTYIKEKIRK